MATNTRAKKNAPAKKTPVPHDDRLQYVYTDKAGNNYFEFIHDASMPFKRYVNAQIAEKELRLGISVANMQSLVKVCDMASVDPKKTIEDLRRDILTIGSYLKGRLGYMLSQSYYENFAATFYLLENEPLVPSDAWYLKKRDIWADEEEARTFFLHGAFQKIHGFINTSVETMMLSFKAQTSREENLPNPMRK